MFLMLMDADVQPSLVIPPRIWNPPSWGQVKALANRRQVISDIKGGANRFLQLPPAFKQLQSSSYKSNQTTKFNHNQTTGWLLILYPVFSYELISLEVNFWSAAPVQTKNRVQQSVSTCTCVSINQHLLFLCTSIQLFVWVFMRWLLVGVKAAAKVASLCSWVLLLNILSKRFSGI